MLIDFLLSEYALGFSQGEVRRLNPARLCDDQRGLSGTEVNAFGLAYALQQQGHHVRIFSHVTQQQRGHCVEFFDMAGHWALDTAHVAVAFHDSTPLLSWKAGKKVVWHQTVHPLHSERMAEEPVDLYISATSHNARQLSAFTPGKSWAIIPNGWDFGAYQPHTPVPGRLFYHTSPERGLHILLRALPLIKQSVPSAHLDVWCRMESVEGHHPQVWAEIQQGLIACKEYVTVHPQGGSRNQVLAALAQASVLAYPSEPPMPCEVMPVSIMEACATGVPVVTAPSDGFEKAFGNALCLSESPPSQHLEAFVHRVCALLQDQEWQGELTRRGQAVMSHYTFETSAQRFLEVIRG